MLESYLIQSYISSLLGNLIIVEEQHGDCSTTIRSDVLFVVTMRKFDTFSRNYGSHCVRSYGVTTLQLYDNATHMNWLENFFSPYRFNKNKIHHWKEREKLCLMIDFVTMMYFQVGSSKIF